MTYLELENKIKSMSAKEIILAMVEGLQNPVTRIDMNTFGMKSDNICYGCAATNTILKLGGLDPEKEIIEDGLCWTRKYSVTWDMFLSKFEVAINYLRMGGILNYNDMAKNYGFAQIKIDVPECYLPRIDNTNYKDPEVLQSYIHLANSQDL